MVQPSDDAFENGQVFAPDSGDAPALEVGMKVEAKFDLVENGENVGKWYLGTIVGKNEMIEQKKWTVLFEDGDEFDYDGLGDDGLRLASGPWERWFDEYLPQLVLSAFRAARRDPTLRSPLDMILPREDCNLALDGDLSSSVTPLAGRRRGKRAVDPE